MSRKPLKRRVSERAIHQAVIAHWRAFGVPGSLVATIPNMRAMGQSGLTPGLPDLIVISPALGHMAGFLELKADDGHLSEAQADFEALCALRGIPWAVTFGRDQPIRQLELWGAVKAMVRQ